MMKTELDADLVDALKTAANNFTDEISCLSPLETLCAVRRYVGGKDIFALLWSDRGKERIMFVRGEGIAQDYLIKNSNPALGAAWCWDKKHADEIYDFITRTAH